MRKRNDGSRARNLLSRLEKLDGLPVFEALDYNIDPQEVADFIKQFVSERSMHRENSLN